MTPKERNEKVSKLMEELYTSANDTEFVFDDSEYKRSLDFLFTTTAWGFREIILVVVAGMILDSKYRASTGLYDCEPRAVYEGPIKEFLIKYNIPHRQSGPLNIAKAAKGLDETWAAQRRPQAVATEVLKIVNYMENSPSEEKTKNVGISLLRKLIAESKRVESLSVEIEPTEDPNRLFFLCSELIRKTPDSGNTPQKIAAFLLKNYHLAMSTGVVVTGENDRASVTSTTSKKPGDVNEESAAGEIYKVYEITVKPFDIARIRDSYDCIRAYNEANGCDLNEVIVICRPEDCPSDIQSSGLHLYMGSYEYQNIIYYYWNIFEWVADTLQRMTGVAKSSFYSDLNTYIADVNTAEAVKTLWSQLHQ
ncbi:MAG TPA: hypothetical protein DCK81_02645 [Clostridiales bacterium UBA9856]|nr:hypothetical protein [Clostridiales bacterium UBA9856]